MVFNWDLLNETGAQFMILIIVPHGTAVLMISIVFLLRAFMAWNKESLCRSRIKSEWVQTQTKGLKLEEEWWNEDHIWKKKKNVPKSVCEERARSHPKSLLREHPFWEGVVSRVLAESVLG